MRRQIQVLVVLGLTLLCPLAARSQVEVIDIANLVENTFTALQTFYTVANQILDLTPVDEIVLSEAFVADLEALATIVNEAHGLSYDIARLNVQVKVLFDLDNVPDHTTGLRLRLLEAQHIVYQSYVYAMQTQTLLQTSLSAVRRLGRLTSAIGHFIGNMQSNQTLSQVDGTLTEALLKLQVQTTAYQRAQSVERLVEPMIIESLHRINEQLLMDHPQ